MRIAYIYTAITEVGGVDRILTQKANYLAEKAGWEVFVITDSQCGRPLSFPLSDKVKYIDLGIDFGEQYLHGIVKRTWLYFKLMKQYKKALAETLKNLRLDVVVTVLGRDMDFLTRLDDGSHKIGESHCPKQVCRNFHLMEQRGFPYRQVAHYWRRKQEKAVSELDALVLLTDHDRQSWADVKEGLVIPNSVAFYPEESSELSAKRCIMVGRFSELKGHEYLFETWALVAQRHPDWTLECYGQGDRTYYQQLVDDKGLTEKVHLNDATPNIKDEYLKSSLYVMSSKYEGFGLVLAEAMACGVPCVSFDCPYGPADVIRNGEDGILVEHLNTKALADAICRLIEDADERQRLGQNAKRNIARYKEENVMQQWVKLFETYRRKA